MSDEISDKLDEAHNQVRLKIRGVLFELVGYGIRQYGYTVEQIAERADIKEIHLNGMLGGSSSISFRELSYVASAVDCQLEFRLVPKGGE